MKNVAFLLILLTVSFHGLAQGLAQLSQIPKTKGKTKGETALSIGKTFLGKPYLAKTLEKAPEQLVCNLNGLDCYTFVESVVALTNCVYGNGVSEANFKQEVQKMRYRDGIIDGYPSRIHYFTEWIDQNEANGIVENMTKKWGVESKRNLNFMSSHPQYYAALSNPEALAEVAHTERQISRIPFYEIPKSKFKSIENFIQNGDIIVFTTTVQGLDVNHEGFAIWQNGKLHLMHASLDHKKVIISPETLEQYLQNIKKHAGIMVLRLQ